MLTKAHFRLKAYQEALYEYYVEGKSTFDLILHEYSGFIDCLCLLDLMEMENNQLELDNFRERLKCTDRYKMEMK